MRHLSIKAEDLRSGKRRRLPDGNVLFRILTRGTGAGLQQAAAEATAVYDTFAKQVWADDMTGQRTVIRTKLSQEETRSAIDDLNLTEKLIGDLWLTNITDGELMALKMAVG